MTSLNRISALAGLLLLPLAGSELHGQDRSIFELLEFEGRELEAGIWSQGELTRSDYLMSDDQRGQAWLLNVGSDGPWQFRMMSGDFDSHLRVLGSGLGEGLTDDDGGDGVDAALCATLAAGEYRIIAASLYGDTGNFEIIAERLLSEDDCEVDLSYSSVSTDPMAMEVEGRLVMGTEASAVMVDRYTWDDRVSAAWELEAEAGDEFVLDMRAEDFDAYLEVIGPGISRPLTDDDGGCGTGARITLRATESGSYRVVASTLFGGLGEYVLRVAASEGALAECVDEYGDFGDFGDYGGDFFSGEIRPEDLAEVSRIGEIDLGERRDGQLDEFSNWIADGNGDVWRFDGAAGDRIAITVDADFDPRVYLVSDLLEFSYMDDDGGDELNSRLCTEIPATGEYAILVRGFEAEPVGEYILGVETDPAPNSCYFQLGDDQLQQFEEEFRRDVLAEDHPSIGMNEVVDGELRADLVRHVDPIIGRGYDSWSLRLAEGDEVFIDLRADFDPFLLVFGPFDAEWSNDDGPCGLNSQIEFAAPHSGEYVILAGSVNSTEESPAYDLSVRDSPSRCTEAFMNAPVAGQIEIGGVREGFLSPESTRSPRGAPMDVWLLEVQRESRVVIDLVADFDAYLYLTSEGTPDEWQNDDGRCGLHSRIDEVLPAGRYRIMASALSSLALEDPHAYTLSVNDRARPCARVPGNMEAVSAR